MVNTCRVEDLPFQGNNITWSGKRKTHLVQSWIHRALGNDEWRATFPASVVTYLEMIESDHRPAIIQIQRNAEFGKKMFCYDSHLFRREGFKQMVMDDLKVLPADCTSLTQRLRRCRHSMSEWKKENISNSATETKLLTQQIDLAHSIPLISSAELFTIRKELIQAYNDEETYWNLKSRNKWLQKGDRNTRFYHASTKNRRAFNKTTTIKSTNGVDLYGSRYISSEALTYFSNIFTSTLPADMDDVLSNIVSVVSHEMNLALVKDVTMEEVRQSVFSNGASRAPGPDGLTAAFYQQFWDSIGPLVTTEVQRFFDIGEFPVDFNHAIYA